MPLTALDPKAALIVIDLQKGVVGLATAHPTADMVRRSADLARAFRARGHVVVWVNVSGRAPGRTEAGPPRAAFPAGWDELVPELGVQPGDLRITKQHIGAFLGTSLDAALRQRGVTQVVMTGVATGSGVEGTARSAHDLGYNVAFVTDAMTDMDAEVHRLCVEKLFPRYGELITTDGLLALLKS